MIPESASSLFDIRVVRNVMKKMNFNAMMDHVYQYIEYVIILMIVKMELMRLIVKIVRNYLNLIVVMMIVVNGWKI